MPQYLNGDWTNKGFVVNTYRLPRDTEFRARPALYVGFDHAEKGTAHQITMGRNSAGKWDISIDTEADDYLRAQLISRDVVNGLKAFLPITAEDIESTPGHELNLDSTPKNSLKAMRRVSLNNVDDYALSTVLEMLYQPLQMEPQQFYELKDAAEAYAKGVRRAEELAAKSATAIQRGKHLVAGFLTKSSGKGLNLEDPLDRALFSYVGHLEREQGHSIALEV